ncbi:hypothetical protein D3C87_1382410 [compost metagenome]
MPSAEAVIELGVSGSTAAYSVQVLPLLVDIAIAPPALATTIFVPLAEIASALPETE